MRSEDATTATTNGYRHVITGTDRGHPCGPRQWSKIHPFARWLCNPPIYKRGFVIRVDDLNIQGEPGQRDKTVIRRDGMRGTATHVFLVQGKNFQVAHLTLGWVKHHVVQVKGERGASSPRFFDVAFINAGQQLFKVTGRGGTTADQGVKTT